MTGIERCRLTELLVTACGCPQHRGGDLPEIETVGQSFEAMYPGLCERCEKPIEPGQQIARVADPRSETRPATAGYVHVVRCPR